MKTNMKKLAIAMAISGVVSTSAFAEIKTTTLGPDIFDQGLKPATVTLPENVTIETNPVVEEGFGLAPKKSTQLFTVEDVEVELGLGFYDKNQTFTVNQRFSGPADAFNSNVIADNSGQYFGGNVKVGIKKAYAEAEIATRIGGSASHNDCNTDGSCPLSDAASNLSGTDWKLKFGYNWGQDVLPADSRWELDSHLSFMGSKIDSGSFVQDNMTRNFDMSQNEWAIGTGAKFNATENFGIYTNLSYGFIDGDYSSVATTNSGISITEKNDINFDGSGFIFELGAVWNFAEGYSASMAYQKKLYSVSIDSTLSAEPLVSTTSAIGIEGDLEEDRFDIKFEASFDRLGKDVVRAYNYFAN